MWYRMPYKSPSTIVGADADALAEALESVAGDELQLVAEYDPVAYDVLYVADSLLDHDGQLDGVLDDLEGLFPYYHLDFLQRKLVHDILWLGEVGTYVTFLERGIVVRAHNENDGVFVVLDASASIDDVQVAIENTFGEQSRQLPLHG